MDYPWKTYSIVVDIKIEQGKPKNMKWYFIVNGGMIYYLTNICPTWMMEGGFPYHFIPNKTPWIKSLS